MNKIDNFIFKKSYNFFMSSILKAMMTDHGFIYGALAKFRMELSHFNDSEKAALFFEKFYHREIRHMGFEESAILKSRFLKKSIVDKTRKDHKKIMGLMDKMKKDLENNICKRSSLNSLQRQLKKHLNFEETNLYPVLEKGITKELKEKIIVSIKEYKDDKIVLK